MKHIITLLLFISTLCSAQNTTGYDLIIKTDKTEIKAKVIEVQQYNVVYKKFENLNGPNYTVAKNEVFMILYANGTKETFDTPAPATAGNYRAPGGILGNTQSVNPVYNSPQTPAQRPAVNQMVTSDFKYHPIRLLYNPSTDYDYAFTFMGDIPLSDVSNPQSSAFSHFNLGVIFSGAGLTEDYGLDSADLTLMDIGLYINWYLPINKLSGSYKVNTGLFPFVYAGGVYRSTTWTYSYDGEKVNESTGDFAGGVGLDWRFTRGFGLTVTYDYSYNAGAGIHFSF